MSTKDIDNFMTRIENEPAPAIVSNEKYSELLGGDLGSGLHLIRVKNFAEGTTSIKNIANSVFTDEVTDIISAHEETNIMYPMFKALYVTPETPEGTRFCYTPTIDRSADEIVGAKSIAIEDVVGSIIDFCEKYKGISPGRRILLVVNIMAFYMRQLFPDEFYPSDCQEQLQADRKKLYWEIVRALGQINIYAAENCISVVLATNLNYETEAYPVINARNGEFLEG